MAKQNKKREKEQLSIAIQQENEMLKRVVSVIKAESVILALFLILLVWGATGLTDPFLPSLSAGAKTVMKWVGMIGSIVFAILVVLSFFSYYNGKKSVLDKIRHYQNM
ncbi:MAG: hypothetical protein J6D18_04885 [Erysipelotrichaceae bacterium]|nr:hypothetical protein [Erysipelotrichaceae bacterium]